MMIALGKCFMPIIQVVLPVLNALVKGITVALNAVSNFMYVLLGVKLEIGGSGGGAGLDNIGASIGDVSDSVGGIGDNAGKADKQVKKLKGDLMGFDEIHKLNINDDADSGSSGGSGGVGGGGGVGGIGTITPTVDMKPAESYIEQHISALAKRIRGYFSNISFQPLINSFNKLKKACEPIINTIGKGLEWFIQNIIAPLTQWVIEDALPAFFDLLTGALNLLDPILDTVGKALKDLWDDFLEPVMDWAADKFVEFLEWLADKLTELGKWLDEHQDVKDNISKIIEIVAGAFLVVKTITGIIGVLGKVGGAFTTVTGIIKGFIPFVTGVGSAIATGISAIAWVVGAPVWAVVAVIAAAVAAIIGIVHHWDDIVKGFKGAWKSTGQYFTDMGNDVVAAFGEFGQAFEGFANWIGDGADALISGIDKGIKDFGKGFMDACDSTKQYFVDMGTDLKNALAELRDKFNNFCNKIGEFVDKAGQKVKNTLTAAGKYVWDQLCSIGRDFKQTGSEIKNVAVNIWRGITNTFSNIGGWFGEKFRNAASAVKNAFSSIPSFFSNLFSRLVGIFRNVGTAVGNAIGGAVRIVINNVLSGAVRVINGFIGMINGAVWLINKIPGVHVSSINYLYAPRLAKGGIVKRSTLANIGENGAEAVIPLENNTGWIDKLADRVTDRLGANDYNNNKNSDKSLEVNMRVGTSEFGRIIINSLSAWEKQQGKSVLDVL